MHGEFELKERPANSTELGSVALRPRMVEKPWGRTDLPAEFGSTGGRKIGEIWFEHPSGDDLPLLAKYIFTSEKLSIQVHPDDAFARRHGLDHGKSECWYVLDAGEGATLGLGLTRDLSSEEIRAAALDGSIELLLAWTPVSAGDFIFVPAGTIHAIGAGIALLEFQQNTDVTYRLYDYGRPRELHLEDATEVARSGFDCGALFGHPDATEPVLIDRPQFSLIRAKSEDELPASLARRRRWVMPLEGSVTTGDVRVFSGDCMLAGAGDPLSFSSGAVALVGVEGAL